MRWWVFLFILILFAGGLYGFLGNWGGIPLVTSTVQEQMNQELRARFSFQEVRGNPFRGLEFLRPSLISQTEGQWKCEAEKFTWQRTPSGITWKLLKGSVTFSRLEDRRWNFPTLKKSRTLVLSSLSFHFTDVEPRSRKKLIYTGEFDGTIRFSPKETRFVSFHLRIKPGTTQKEREQELKSEQPYHSFQSETFPEGRFLYPSPEEKKAETPFSPITLNISGKGAYNPDNHNYSLTADFSMFSLKTWLPYLLQFTGIDITSPGEGIFGGHFRALRSGGALNIQGTFSAPSAFLFGLKLENMEGNWSYQPFHLKIEKAKFKSLGAELMADSDFRLIYKKNLPLLSSFARLTWTHLPSRELLAFLPYSFRLPLENDLTSGDLKISDFLGKENAAENMFIEGLILSENGTVRIYNNPVQYNKIELPIKWEKGILQVKRGHFIAMDGQWIGVGKIRYDWNRKQVSATAFFAVPLSALPIITSSPLLPKIPGIDKETSIIVVGYAFGSPGNLDSGFLLPGRYLIRFSSANPEKRLDELWKQYLLSEWARKVSPSLE
ncbi:MAG: hypothetical protein V2G33_02480 [bacterium JZ-2024 1]